MIYSGSNVVKRYLLNNGTTILMEPDERFKSAAIGFFFEFGSGDEKNQETGYTHFIEHMLFKGTKKRTAEEIAKDFDRIGGLINAYTDRDETCIHCAVPGKDVDFALEILTDMIFSSGFEKREFQHEKDVIINEALTSMDDPEEAGLDEFLMKLWPNSSYGKKITGTPVEIENIELKKLYNYYKAEFVPERLIIVGVGAIDENKFLHKLESLLPETFSPPIQKKIIVPQTDLFCSAVKTGISQVYLFTGIPLVPPFSVDDYWILTIANSAFGDATSSRLFLELREKQGLCYYANSGFSISPTIGLWNVIATTTPDKFSKMIEIYSSLVKNFFKNGLTKTEISDAKSRITGTLLIESDDLDWRLKRLIRLYSFDCNTESMDQSLKKISSYSEDEINNCIFRILDIKKESFFAWGKIKTDTIKVLQKHFEEKTIL